MAEITCTLCPLKCALEEGKVGKCRVRGNVLGQMRLLTYGMVTTAIVSPIEQKPIYHYAPGMKVLSIGGSGCNLVCKYCQNFEISQVAKAGSKVTIMSPEDVIHLAKQKNCGGIAFTYSEPFVWFEYVMDVAEAARAAGLKTILKTAAYADEDAFARMFLRMDAVNIDIKGDRLLYKEVCGLDLQENYRDWAIWRNLYRTARTIHTEISCIAIPRYWANAEYSERMFTMIEEATGKIDVPIHILRFYPDFQMKDPPTTDAELDMIAGIAKKHFRYVYIDYAGRENKTVCECGLELASRTGVVLKRLNVNENGTCPLCRKEHYFTELENAKI